MSFIRTPEDLKNLKYSCRLLGSLFYHLRHSVIRPGIDASSIDQFVEHFAKHYGAKPSFKGYKGYPYNLNFSLNNEVTHAFPAKGRVVPPSGLLKIDIGLVYQGMVSDKCETFVLGNVSDDASRLNTACKEALLAGISIVKAGIRLGDIGNAVDTVAKKNKLGNVKVLGGHGVGYVLHDDPWIPHFGKPGRGQKLLAGQAITIEPMFTLGGDEVEFSQEDGWTVTTADGSLSAQWEETIYITPTGYQVLTHIPETDILPAHEKLS